MKNNSEITCTVEFTEGAIDRITYVFIDAYHDIKSGKYNGPLPDDEKKNNSP